MATTDRGLVVPDVLDPGVQWAEAVKNGLHRLADTGANAKSYNAAGDASAEDAPELQDWINDNISSGAAVSVARDGKSKLILPPGGFKVSTPLSAASLRGMGLQGQGPWVTKLYPAVNMASVLDLNGIFMSEIGGFSVHGTLQGATKVDNIIDLYWDSAGSARSTNMVTLRNIQLVDATFTTAGFRTTKTSNSPQVDLIKFYDCYVNGGWAGTGTDSQSGFHFGSGTAGNALGHYLYGCQVSKTRYGLTSQGVSFGFWGGQMTMGGGVMDRAFNISSSPLWVVIQGMRSESAKRLIQTLGWSTSTNIELDTVEYQADQMDADTFFVNILSGGSILIRNVQCFGADGGRVRLAPATAGWFLNASLDGLTIRGTDPLSALSVATINGTTEVEARGIQKSDSSNAVTDQLVGRIIGSGAGGLVRDLAGAGTPEGAITANKGSTYRRTDGGAGTSYYVKESGTGNTGWVAK